MLGECAARFALEAGKRDVALELDCEAGDARFDRGQMTQVVNNLLDNAVHHARMRSRVASAGSSRRAPSSVSRRR